MSDGSITLPALRLFADVARTGALAAAARERGVDPSVVSRQIAGLETALGFRLFDRTTRRLNLTEAGRLYLQRSRPLMDELDAARQEAADALALPSGLLRVTASIAFGERWLTPRLRSFCDAFPAIALDLRLSDAVVDIAAEGIDLALRLAPRPDGALIATKLMDTRYRVVAAPNYVAASAPIAQPDDLADHACLLLPLPGYRSLWRFRRGDVLREVPVKGRITASSPLAIHRAACDGMGPALLADWTIGTDIDEGRLVDCLPDWDVSAADFDTAAWMLYPSRAYVPGKTRVFIDHLKASV